MGVPRWNMSSFETRFLTRKYIAKAGVLVKRKSGCRSYFIVTRRPAE